MIIVAALSGFVLAIFAPWLHRRGRRATAWLMALLPLAHVVYFASFIIPITEGEDFTFTHAWVPSLSINLSFHVDGLSLIFALLISGIGMLVVIYGGEYLHSHPQLGRFYASLLMFMASMLGVVLADNLITLFVFWELTSLSSYLLIGFDYERAAARAAALQALLVTGVGGLALLAGFILLGNAGGSLELSVLLDRGESIRSHSLYLPILLLVLAGAFTKSAQVPFYFWLPSAMEAPTPVSAYLHSATMVKAGVYLLARLSPILGHTEAWHYQVTLAGAVTMLIGAALALAQTDLKRILAYSTVSALGTLTLLIGLDTTQAMKAAMVFLLVHSLYKGALFLVAGAVDHETGTRNVELLGGLRRRMPIITVAALLAALSMAGLPPLFGFISKELLYEAKLQAPNAAWLITGAGVAANVLMVALAGIVGLRPFFGKQTETPKAPHEPPFALWFGPALLAITGLIIGLFPDTIATPLVAAAVSVARAQPTEIELALWHGLNPILALSIATVASGAGVYLVRHMLRRHLARRVEIVAPWGPTRLYGLTLEALSLLARAQTRLLQSGYLRFYLMLIIATTVGLVGYTLAGSGQLNHVVRKPSEATFYEIVVAVLILFAAVVVTRAQSRLAAVAALGVVGYGVAMIFIFFSAPDLAMTQFTIETLTVVLFVLVIYKLPRFVLYSRLSHRLRDALVALAAGGMMTMLILIITAAPSPSRLTSYFAENSLLHGKGRNVVNLILVDFRGLDTLGEITVLAIAAIGVYALLKLRLEKDGD
jgi:multicomponent Na+:H+ antiporter subunit A